MAGDDNQHSALVRGVEVRQARTARQPVGARSWRREWPLRAHLLLFALALVIPVLLIAAAATNRFAASERQVAEHQAQALARSVSNQIDRELYRQQAILKTLSGSRSLEDGNYERFRHQANLALGGADMQIRLLDRNLKPLMDTRVPEGQAVPEPSIRDEGEQVLRTGEPRISGLLNGRAPDGDLALGIEVPVIHDNQVHYVLALTVKPTRFLEIIAAEQRTRGWTVGVSDVNNVIIARNPGHEQFAGRSLSSDALANSIGQEGVHRGVSLDGEEVMRAYVRSALSGWMVAVFTPVASIEEPLRRSWLIFALVAFGLLLLSVSLAVVFGRMMSRPIGAIRDSARALGRGEIVPVFESSVHEANEVARELRAASLERKRREERLQFLMNELRHRTKNLLTIIQAIARQSKSKSADLDEFEARFGGRLRSLSESLDLAVMGDWSGIDLRELIRRQLAPFATIGGRLALDGPSVILSTEAAQQIGSALHELATNATKYGALSVPTGAVTVSWRFDDPTEPKTLAITWTERGGPPIAKPSARGFGRTVTEKLVPSALEAGVTADYATEGLIWRIELPVSQITRRATPGAGAK